ncbi:MAG: tetratricopeptide repeat protein [Planctomycetes bacterium]|jgi:tetratricopeptide (TPR) repeat protein|nr:tetratricopeptide repeat protein [Planctomycetota bacterium]MBT7131248.1 tetratricopeptide repeat protein [Planctomycetota bacterium]
MNFPFVRSLICSAAILLLATVQLFSFDLDERAELLHLIETGQYQEAGDWVEEEPGIFPLLEARLFRETGRSEQALKSLTSHPLFAGDTPDLLVAAAGLELDRGRDGVAEAYLLKALDAEPKHIEAGSRFGLLKIKQGKRTEGEKKLREVLDLYKKMSREEAQRLSPDQFVWFGKTCEGLNRFRDAYEVMYDSALYIDKNSVVAHAASGLALNSKYNYPDSRSHYRDALSTNPRHVESLIGLARSTWSDYRFPGERGQEVHDLIARAKAVSTEYPAMLILEGDLAFGSERWDEAEQLYRAVLEIDPTHQEAQGLLAAVLWATARLDEFEQLQTSVEEAHPAPAVFHVTLAERLVDRFFYRESTEHAQKAMTLDPGLPRSYAIFSINALRSGFESEGRVALEEAWLRDKYNVWVKNTRTLMSHIDEKFTTTEEDGLVIRMRSDEEPWLMPYILPLLLDTRAMLDRDYETAIARPLTVEDFSDHSYFSARSIGLPGLAASGVCFGRLVTLTTPNAIPGNWGAVAVHEFAHVATLQKAKHRIPRWFGEGLSVYEEGRTQPRWKRNEPLLMASEFHGGTLRGIDDLQGAFMSPRWRNEIMVGYVQSGLICEMIGESHGLGAIRKMLEAYSLGGTTSEVIRGVLGQSTDQFDAQMKAWLGAWILANGVGPSFQQRHVDHLKERAENSPDDASAWAWLAAAYLGAGRKADAELSMGRASKVAEGNADLAAVQGWMQLSEGKVDSAIESLRKAIAGESIWTYRCQILLAQQLRKRGDSQEALDLYAAATIRAPRSTRSPVGGRSPWIELATIQDDLGLTEESIDSLRAQVANNRDDAPTRLALAQRLAQKEDWPGVVDAAWDLPFISPYADDGHALLAQAFIQIEAWGKARRELELRLAAEAPALKEIYPDYCWVLWKLDEKEKALKFSIRALRLVPASVRAQQVRDALESED